MRKLILAIAASFGLLGSAQANLLNPVPFPEIGSLDDVTHNAAFAIFQTYTPPAPSRTQVSITDPAYGGVCDGVADDTAAFNAFRVAWTGTTPVQLNLPVGTCTFLPTGGGGNPNFFMFRGVQDLIVNGQGTGSSSIKNIGTGGATLFLGGSAQYQDSNHSLRTETAIPGDSCVIAKTQPAVTVSDIQNNMPVSGKFTASISTTTMTVTAVSSGTVASGAFINGGVASFTKTVSQLTGTGGAPCPDPTCNGTTGTYQITPSQTAPSQPMTMSPATFTATIDAAGVMTVSAVANGSLTVGMWIYRALGSVGKPFSIASQLTGSAGSTGTYQLNLAPLSALSTPSDFIGNGQPRVTLNSTTGLTTGDTLFLTNVAGTAVLPQRVNGLRWIKVINGTQIDLFQEDFNGSYTSGGTGGGDRTSLMPTGSKVMMTGWNNQSYWAFPYSYPTNPHWFEYKTVTSTNPTTHQICFDTPLTNTYKSTWPQMNTGSQFEADPGGPATLYVIHPSWEMTAVFQNFTLDSTTQTYAQGRNITYSNVVMTGAGCAIPTQNETFTWTNVTGTLCTIETDKIVKTWNLTNSTLRKMHVQSSSIETMNINNVTADVFLGTSKIFNATGLTTTCLTFCPNANTDFSFTAGVGVYGVADSFSCTNCAVSSPPGSTAGNGFSQSVPLQEVNAANRSWSMSGGVITIPNALSWSPSQGATELQYKTLLPGYYAFWQAGSLVGRAFKIIDVTQDVDNTYVQTSEAGGFPTGAWAAGTISVMPHPAPQFTATSPTGAPSWTIFDGCPAASPIYTCQNFTYTGSSTGGSTQGFSPRVWGVIDTFTFTNNVPYTNTGALGWTVTRFANWQVLTTGLSLTPWGATNMVNTKLPATGGGGTRTLTASGLTGGQTLDNISAPPTDAWFGGPPLNGPIFTANTPSDSPQVTITLRTNQQLPP